MKITGTAIVSVLSVLWACSASAAEAPEAAPTKQAREQMALRHEKMAACLRSDRPLTECRSEMMHAHSIKADAPDGRGCSMGKMDRDAEAEGTPKESEHSDHKH